MDWPVVELLTFPHVLQVEEDIVGRDGGVVGVKYDRLEREDLDRPIMPGRHGQPQPLLVGRQRYNAVGVIHQEIKRRGVILEWVGLDGSIRQPTEGGNLCPHTWLLSEPIR